jgi:hypothetical protein
MEVVKAIEQYEERRAGYDVSSRGNSLSRIGLPLNAVFSTEEIAQLFRIANEKYRQLCDGCRVAHHFKGNDIPEDPLDPHLFGISKLRTDLADGAKIFDVPSKQ